MQHTASLPSFLRSSMTSTLIFFSCNLGTSAECQASLMLLYLVIFSGEGKLKCIWNPLALCPLHFIVQWVQMCDMSRSMLQAYRHTCSVASTLLEWINCRLSGMWCATLKQRNPVWKWTLMENEVMFWDRGIVWSCSYPCPLLETGSFFVPKNRTSREGKEQSQDKWVAMSLESCAPNNTAQGACFNWGL